MRHDHNPERRRRLSWQLATWLPLLAAFTGCATGPLVDNPAVIVPDPCVQVENPVFVPLGPPSYGVVFEKVLDIVNDYFEISYSNRYSGQIDTYPRIAPGLEQPWKPGSPDSYERLLASLQTIRYRGQVLIQPADDGGFFVQVTVYKELEDLEKPTSSTAGSASFRSDNTIERQFEVVDPTSLDHRWIPRGRETHLEQLILQRIKCSM
jgi:hypothetical protein